MDETKLKLIVAMTALAKIAYAPSFNGALSEQRTAMTALETIRAIEKASGTP